MSRVSPFQTALGAALLMTGHASAQVDLTLELGASQIGPAVGLEAADARYGMGGLRLSALGGAGSGIFASFLAGRVMGADSTGGSFASGLVEATLRDTWSDGWTGVMDARLLAFGVRDPFPYRAMAVEIGQGVEYRSRHVSADVDLVAGMGRARVELWRTLGGPTRIFARDLWRFGTEAEVLVGSPTVQVGLAGSAHKSRADVFAALGARMVVGGGWGALELQADRWRTPAGFETTGGLAFVLPLGRGWSFRGFVGRSQPDPLTLAQPGSGSGGALLGWRVYSSYEVSDGRGMYEVVGTDGGRSRVRIVLDDAPEGSGGVALLGDFTLWEPVQMKRNGDRWEVEIEVRPGAYHFGFLVDEEWYLPDDAPDVVPDEWGRSTATLVIEGAGS